MIKYQGDSIGFQFDFVQGDNTYIGNFSYFNNIILFLYTDGCHVERFRKNANYGDFGNEEYIPLYVRNNDESLTGFLYPEKTKLFNEGPLNYEIKFIYYNDEDRRSSDIRKGSTGIMIKKDIIKNI